MGLLLRPKAFMAIYDMVAPFSQPVAEGQRHDPQSPFSHSHYSQHIHSHFLNTTWTSGSKQTILSGQGDMTSRLNVTTAYNKGFYGDCLDRQCRLFSACRQGKSWISPVNSARYLNALFANVCSVRKEKSMTYLSTWFGVSVSTAHFRPVATRGPFWGVFAYPPEKVYSTVQRWFAFIPHMTVEL